MYTYTQQIISAAVLLCLSAFAAAAQVTVNAAWSQIFGQTELMESGEIVPFNVHMRFVLSGETDLNCEDFTIKLKGQTVLITKWTTRRVFNLNDIMVCDAPMSEEWPEATLALSDGTVVQVPVKTMDGETQLKEVRFPGPTAIGRRQLAQGRGDAIEVGFVGNTGCRGSDAAVNAQDCDDLKTWPFATLVDHMARPGMAPDLVFHLGNIRYFRPSEQHWDRWHEEFFEPAQALLLEVPWVFTRGSQESCSARTAGIGWFLLFGPVGMNGEIEGCERRQPFVPTYYFDVHVRSTLESSEPHRFVVVDTGPNPESSLVKNLEFAVDAANRGWAETLAHALIVTHRPIWGLDTFDGFMQQHSDGEVLSSLSRAMRSQPDGPCKPYVSSKCGFKAVVSAFQEAFEVISFPGQSNPETNWALPQQLVVGNSGVVLKKSDPNKSFDFDNAGFLGRDGQKLCGKVSNWSYEHGYLVLKRGQAGDPNFQSGWEGAVRLLDSEQDEVAFKEVMIAGSLSEIGKQNACHQ